MRAVYITKTGGTDVLQVKENEEPTPGPNEVRIRAKACGVSFGEVALRQGLYPGASKFPLVAGCEAAGVVDLVGASVASVKPNARVLTLVESGAQTEALCVDARQVVLLPEAMSFEQAAALPVNYLTAFHALFRLAHIAPGETVVVHAAAGGVGIAALQLCRTVEGVTAIGTASASKHDAVRGNGCDYPIDYHAVDYSREVRRITEGRGVDVVLDPLGGRDWRKGAELLKPGGRLVAYGFSNAIGGGRRSLFRIVRQFLATPHFSPLWMMTNNRSIAGFTLANIWREDGIPVAQIESLVELFRRSQVNPLVDSVFPFSQAAAAYRRLEERRNVGKVLLVPD